MGSAGTKAIASMACFSTSLALDALAGWLAEPYKGAAILCAFFFVGLGWAFWLFLGSD